MGSREQIDDLIESGTIRLLNWNGARIDIQLGMRFVEIIQAISAIQKWSIRIGREFKVVKRLSKQASKYNFKIYFKTNITSCCQQSRDPCLERHPRSASITSDRLYVQEDMRSRNLQEEQRRQHSSSTPAVSREVEPQSRGSEEQKQSSNKGPE
ncbi:hypothetical protein M9H77_30741 [Catharanthus roseus]|uniref:Uncharacterized protein n=1 Tax=Catharanthus roseus TaxID=4058 RepID=A0ACB9ZYY5_CATRO|nr:hypothetical protein M9H77_30741 [Catharanthus roseus]